MSEHPELREALAVTLDRYVGFADAPVDAELYRIADALLAGPVGKLQAELEAAEEVLAWANRYAHATGLFTGGFQMDTYVAIVEMLRRNDEADDAAEQLADPERFRREAIGARALDIAAKARPGGDPRRTVEGQCWDAGYNHALDTVLAAGESAVTGEAT